jgi:predicted AlkP superfamily pyrophosphatase or phosphodiesterase
MRNTFIYLVLLFCCQQQVTIAQNTSKNPNPKLIVGIVVDQMSYDMLYRFWENYTDSGFRKLVQQGYSCENTHYNYTPTYTGPGHASIYTGTVPAIHGIIGNNWFDRYGNNSWYCTQDTTVKGVGTITASGNMSPDNLLTTTITDQLKLATNNAAKVIGIALKDRGAILPAGHTADAAYWFDGHSNAWVSSTYYMDQLPDWVADFNAGMYANAYMKQEWNLLLPASDYRNSTADDVPWEPVRNGETTAAFPHITSTATSMESIKGTPYGNSLTTDFAKKALLSEQMGKDQITDFLCISYSSPDYIGHAYGPYSLEIEDTYTRLDRDLATLIQFLDLEVGIGNYVLFLTADHGVAPVPEHMKSLGIPAGLFEESALQAGMEAILDETYGQNNWISQFVNQQVYFNQQAKDSAGIQTHDMVAALREWCLRQPGIGWVFATDELAVSSIPSVYREMFINGIFPKRSGDMQIIFEPNWFEQGYSATTHGTNYAYDTQVPLLWYGWKISNGKTWKRTAIIDIAPTIAAMLRIPQPNGCIGKVIEDMK